MSVIGERALVGRALFDVMREPSFRAWLDRTASGAVDEEGDLVSISVGDGEDAWILVNEIADRGHDVVMCTLHLGQMIAWVLGPSLAAGDSAAARGLPVDPTMSVGDVVDQMLRLDPGDEYVLEFAGERHRAVLAPLAA